MSNDQKNKNKIIVTPYVELDDEEDVYKIRLITIYDKSEDSTIDKGVILSLIKKVLE